MCSSTDKNGILEVNDQNAVNGILQSAICDLPWSLTGVTIFFGTQSKESGSGSVTFPPIYLQFKDFICFYDITLLNVFDCLISYLRHKRKSF